MNATIEPPIQTGNPQQLRLCVDCSFFTHSPVDIRFGKCRRLGGGISGGLPAVNVRNDVYRCNGGKWFAPRGE
jgi:hypothetical protein